MNFYRDKAAIKLCKNVIISPAFAQLTAGSEMKEPSDDTTVSRYADLAKKLYEKEVSIYEKGKDIL